MDRLGVPSRRLDDDDDADAPLPATQKRRKEREGWGTGSPRSGWLTTLCLCLFVVSSNRQIIIGRVRSTLSGTSRQHDHSAMGPASCFNHEAG